MRAWLSRLTTVILAVAFLFVVFVGYGLINNRWYHILRVDGGSMEPTIHWGDAVIIARPPATLKAGMIVTLEVGGQLVTHRVVSVDPFVTKGDANSCPDQWRPGQVRVVGVVRWRIPRLGQVLHRLRVAMASRSGALFHAADTVSCSVRAADTFGQDADRAPPIVSLASRPAIHEGGLYEGRGSFSDPSPGDAWTAVVDFGDGSGSRCLSLNADKTFALRHVYADSGTFTVTVRVTDRSGLFGSCTTTVIVHNVAPCVGVVWLPRYAVRVGAVIVAAAAFTDLGRKDTHTAVWDWGESTSAGSVRERNGSGKVIGTHTYRRAGVYTIRLTVADKDGASGSVICARRVVICATASGRVKGTGDIDSSAGSYAPAPLAGAAQFRFEAQLGRAALREGAVEFILDGGRVRFRSRSCAVLTVTGVAATLVGHGTVDGQGVYAFTMSVIDGGSFPGCDRFRMRIWNDVTGTVLYDSQPTESPEAAPTAVVLNGDVAVRD